MVDSILVYLGDLKLPKISETEPMQTRFFISIFVPPMKKAACNRSVFAAIADNRVLD